MIEYVLFVMTLFSVFNPEIFSILGVSLVNTISKVIIAMCLLIYVYKLGFRITKKEMKYLKYAILFWGGV